MMPKVLIIFLMPLKNFNAYIMYQEKIVKFNLSLQRIHYAIFNQNYIKYNRIKFYIINIDESKQIPNIFSSILDVPDPISNLFKLRSYSGIKTLIDHDESRQILANLARNIKLIITDYSGNPEKRCRDINYWMNEKITTQKLKIPGDDLKNSCVSVFNDIKLPTATDVRVCVRNPNVYSSEKAKLMKDLDDYCEIRDIHKCNAVTNKNQCIKCNNYIKKKKEEFTRNMEGICSKPNCKLDKYTIACRCTLNDMDLTFPVKNCDELYKEPEIKKFSLLEIGFFVIVTFILFYLFILFLEKVK
ncbi:hypothetical protein PVBG_00627 [Plasmodium vivax Brazil I]|uniref:Uncharacterized protein n=1 Tax=Plasmodium vivax (strain Brazil I) TaxID=1033975 RepID=A0A0J9SNG5_PLAV1|nr:hypothetical protein PVBG_00627 [Plasmodium vivax Brazil I]